jgi:predicted AAA+ superfamily ATPase
LRLVEVIKEDLLDLPELLVILRERREKFILFVDDLSFEDDEMQYKELKALLEGTAQARPRNVAVYATSNRRNLITQRWGERAPSDEEVNPKERLEEKLSLSDRFGVRAAFPAPDQERYLQIVESLASEAGISVPASELRQAAIRWELLHTGRSARTAKQFVIWLQGQHAGT